MAKKDGATGAITLVTSSRSSRRFQGAQVPPPSHHRETANHRREVCGVGQAGTKRGGDLDRIWERGYIRMGCPLDPVPIRRARPRPHKTKLDSF